MRLCCVSELFSDKSNTHEFVDLVKELALPGELTQNRSYDFEFMQVEKPYESYTGANVRLRYGSTLVPPTTECTFCSRINHMTSIWAEEGQQLIPTYHLTGAASSLKSDAEFISTKRSETQVFTGIYFFCLVCTEKICWQIVCIFLLL